MTDQEIAALAEAAAEKALDAAWGVMRGVFAGVVGWPAGKADGFDFDVRRHVNAAAAKLIRAKLAHDAPRVATQRKRVKV